MAENSGRGYSKLWSLIVMALFASFILSACGSDATSTNLPAATTQAVSTTASTTQAVTATTSPTQGTTSTSPTVATTPADNLNGKLNPMLELFGLLPNEPEVLNLLTYNDYTYAKKFSGVAKDTPLQAQPEATKRFFTENWHFYPAEFALTEDSQEDLTNLVGYDLNQFDYDVSAGLPPNVYSVAKGKFNYAQIEKSLTTNAKAVKSQQSGVSIYSKKELDFQNPLDIKLLPPYSFAFLPEKNLLAFTKSTEVTKIVELANKKQEGGSIKDNLWVKEMLSAFGSPQAVYMSNRLVPMPGAFEVLTDDKLSSAERQKKLEELVKTKIIPPLLGGYAYYETVKGEGYYLLADYYLTPEQAKTAQPQIEGFLRNGASNKGKKPFSDSFEVISSETKGNLVLYKVKPKETTPLLRIVLSNELPVFWS